MRVSRARFADVIIGAGSVRLNSPSKGRVQHSFILLSLESVSRDSLLFSRAPLAALDVSILEFFSF
jgi:hypothetical protein